MNAKCYKLVGAKFYKLENCHYAQKVENFDGVAFYRDLAIKCDFEPQIWLSLTNFHRKGVNRVSSMINY